MNSIGMASITAFYNLHLKDKHQRTVPGHMVPRAVRYIPERVCFTPLCLPGTCPILFSFLTHDDVREVNAPTTLHVDGYGN